MQKLSSLLWKPQHSMVSLKLAKDHRQGQLKGPHCVAQTGLELEILLPQLPKC
jgi:hypothetical protein